MLSEQQQVEQDFFNVMARETARANGRTGEYALKMQAMGGKHGQRISQQQ